MKRLIAACLCALPIAASALTIEEAMTSAAASPTAKASGPLTGPFGDVLARELHMSGPMELTVSVVHRFERAGCNRYRIELAAPVGTANAPAPFAMEMNLCANGDPPADAMSYAPTGGQVRLEQEDVERFSERVNSRGSGASPAPAGEATPRQGRP